MSDKSKKPNFDFIKSVINDLIIEYVGSSDKEIQLTLDYRQNINKMFFLYRDIIAFGFFISKIETTNHPAPQTDMTDIAKEIHQIFSKQLELSQEIQLLILNLPSKSQDKIFKLKFNVLVKIFKFEVDVLTFMVDLYNGLVKKEEQVIQKAVNNLFNIFNKSEEVSYTEALNTIKMKIEEIELQKGHPVADDFQEFINKIMRQANKILLILGNGLEERVMEESVC